MPFANRGKELAAKAAVRHLCGPPGDLLKPTLQPKMNQQRAGVGRRRRLKKNRGWTDRAVEELVACGLGDARFETRIAVAQDPPWSEVADVDIRPDLLNPVRKTDGPERRRAVATATLNNLRPATVCV